MCIISLAYKVDSKYPVLFLANRDEFYAREATQMHWWERDNVLAGKDEKAGGTWFGANKSGHWAALTNIRNLKLFSADAKSRGEIIPAFLKEEINAIAFLKNLKMYSAEYNPFNLLLFDGTAIYYYNNAHNVVRKLEPGIYSLSNAFLNTPWPKTEKLAEKLAAKIEEQNTDSESMLAVLSDKARAVEKDLPDTGVGLELETVLSSVFIESPKYGTRCSTFMRVHTAGKTEIWEKTYVPILKENMKHFLIV